MAKMGPKFGHDVSKETRGKIAYMKTEHGHSKAPADSPEKSTYRSWTSIRRRCLQVNDAAYPDYGGRGISICYRWLTYANFLADMGLRPEGTSIDRIDNNGDYEKSNCRWATQQTQTRNRRSNHLIAIDGVERTLAEWAEHTGLASSTIRMRIKNNGGRVDSSILKPISQKAG